MQETLKPCTFIWLRGRCKPLADATLSPCEHAFHFGTAVLEAVRLYHTPAGPRILGWAQHHQRLDKSLKALGLAPLDPEAVTQALAETIDANQLQEGYIRLLAFPNGDCSRLDPGAYPTSLTIQPWASNSREPAPPLSLAVSELHRPPSHCMLSGAKITGGYHLDAAAHHRARTRGFDEALIRHHDGSVCEMTGANLFLVRQGELETPGIDHTIAGLTRSLVQDLAAQEHMPMHLTSLTVSHFQTADEVFATGTYHGIRAIHRLEETHFPAPGPVTRRLQQSYQHMLREPDADLGRRWLAPLT